MIIVRVLPPSFDEEYAKHIGERLFCDEWKLLSARNARGVIVPVEEDDEVPNCSGKPEVEIVFQPLGFRDRRRILLCREHAGYVERQIREAIALVDASDIFGSIE